MFCLHDIVAAFSLLRKAGVFETLAMFLCTGEISMLKPQPYASSTLVISDWIPNQVDFIGWSIARLVSSLPMPKVGRIYLVARA